MFVEVDVNIICRSRAEGMVVILFVLVIVVIVGSLVEIGSGRGCGDSAGCRRRLWRCC